MPDLKRIAASIDKSQSEAIQARATSGQVRSFELMWVTHLIQIHGFKIVPAFTVKQRQNLRDYISRFGPEGALELMVFSVRNWNKVRAFYQFLPPRPVFDSFYFHRDKFLALSVDEADRTRKGSEFLGLAKQAEKEVSKRKEGSLVEMFKSERNKGKEIGHETLSAGRCAFDRSSNHS